MNPLQYYRFKGLWQKTGWLSPAFVGADTQGIVQYISATPPDQPVAVEAIQGFALPGFQNTHSHAFQYAMAGLAETHPSNMYDDFWTWREVMYECALLFDPDEYESVATMLYAEMLRHGYTHVAEFHYLHHDKNGKPYNNLAEMGERLVAAAATAGINITLVPVFYQKGGFNTEPQPRQRRFISKTVDDYLQLLDDSAHAVASHSHAHLAFSVHSLRAADPDQLIQTVANGPATIPFHIHVAEQKKEVADCLHAWGSRPMQWVLDNLPVNDRFHLVHSTHLDDEEVKRLAATKASVVLCPSTEGNLGDGFFRMKEFVQSGGRWSIGTDSHIGLNPLEELRMIDYRQRLVTNLRNPLGENAASLLVNESIATGRKAMGLSWNNHFAVGQPLDALVLDAHAPLLQGSLPTLLPAIVYSSDPSHYYGTLVNGQWKVRAQQHPLQEKLEKEFAKTVNALRTKA
ncbi:MAG: formimidoylglutamate deiminase [Bacteroidia bacterium]|nr:formimidoylglutamate deiminase [Bacteroidia bacterium]